MRYIFDLFLIAVFLLCVFAGKRRGLFRSLFGLLCGILSAMAAVASGKFLAARCYDAVVRPALINRFSEALSADTSADQTSALWSSLPKAIQNLLENEGISADRLEQAAGSAASEAVEYAASAVEPVITGLLEILFSLLLFFVFLLLLRLLARVADGVFQLPVLHGVNTVLGMLFGILTGLLAVFLICIWTGPVLSLFSGDVAAFLQESLDASWIVQWLGKADLLAG